jgi:DNA-directed RNA polymerase subunit L
VSQCSYEYTPDDDKSRQDSNFMKWLATSKKVSDDSKITPERLSELRREFDCLEIQRCYLQNNKGEPYDFRFHIESVGVFNVPIIIERGLETCESLVTPYVDLDVDLPETVVINSPANRMIKDGDLETDETKPISYEFVFRNEEHTLGNLLQTFLIERHVESTEQPRITYAGYKIPHPLKQEMVLIIAPLDGDIMTARKAVANVCKYLKTYFANAKSTWIKTPKVPQQEPQIQLKVETEPAKPQTKQKTARAKK